MGKRFPKLWSASAPEGMRELLYAKETRVKTIWTIENMFNWKIF